jgi:hypothetical protein
MENEDETEFLLRKSVRIVLDIVVLTSATISFIGSFLVIWLLTRKIAKWNSVNFFITAIEIADLFFSVTEAIFPLNSYLNFMVFDDRSCTILLCLNEPEWLRFALISPFVVTAAMKVELQRRRVCQVIACFMFIAIILMIPTAFYGTAHVFKNESYCAFYSDIFIHREKLQMSIEASVFVATALTCLVKFKSYRSSSDGLIRNLPAFYLVFSICWLPSFVYDLIYFTVFSTIPDYVMIASFLKYLIPVAKLSFFFLFNEDLRREMNVAGCCFL